jgi:DedD protein
LAENQDAVLLQRRARRRLVGAIALVVFIVIFLPIILDGEQKPIRQDLTVQIPSQDAGRFNTRVLPPPATRPDEKATPDKPVAEAGTPQKFLAIEPTKPQDAKPAAVDDQAGGASKPAPSEGNASKAQQPVSRTEAAAGPGDKQRAAAAAKERPQSPVVSADKETVKTAESERAQAALGDQAWIVPLGSFSNPGNVKQLQSKLGAAGIKVYSEPISTRQGEQIRVRAGPYASREAAEKVRHKLKEMGLPAGAVASR